MAFVHAGEEHRKHEDLVEALNDPETFKKYKESCDNQPVSFLPHILGHFLIAAGNTLYGKKPSYLKFRAVEVIARVPYHSWVAVSHTLLTRFYKDEKRALVLCADGEFARLSQENETMHVVVISTLTENEERGNVITHTIIPLMFALFYYWVSYLIYLFKPRWSLELNYLFENHALEQYDEFLKQNEESLKSKPIESEFLSWYGREFRTQYDFFQSVRNDELIHRNRSIHTTSWREKTTSPQ
ncbi:MAG: alternative oxidase [Patescibacteria group bacterium UBA2163]